MKCVAKYSKDYSNLPDRYIRRAMRQVYWKTPNAIQYMPKVIEKKKFYFDLSRPWTAEFKTVNPPGRNSKTVYVEPIKEWSFFRGDRVCGHYLANTKYKSNSIYSTCLLKFPVSY